MTNYFKRLSKPGKIVVIAVAVVLILAILAGIGTGIYFGVMTKPYEGIVLEEGTNTPLANVSVSDGKNVVVTGKDGRYRLKGWHKSKFVTVTIPTGYWTEDYYIRQDKKVKSYDFKLKRKAEDDTNHKFLQVSDTEIGKDGVGAWVYDIKKVADEEKPAFIVHTGDICYEPGLRNHLAGMNSNNMGVPVRYVIGNHDYVDYGAYGEALFEEIYGPTYYSFDVGNVHYIVTPFMGGGADRPQRYNKSNVARWVANDVAQVAEGKKIVMFNHDYAPNENEYTLKYGLNKIDLKEKGLIAWAFGHWHYNFVNEKDGVLNISTAKPEGGGIDGSPNGVRVVDIQGGRITSADLKYAYEYKYNESLTDSIANWKVKLNGRGFWGKPIVDNGSIYLATATDTWPSTNEIVKMDVSNGDIKWRYPVKNSIRNDISLYNGKILALDSEGRVYCLNAADGTKVWERDLNLTNPRNTSFNTVIDGDKVYVGNTDELFCLNANDGNIVWEIDETDTVSSPSKLVISGDNLIVHCHWRRVFAVNKNTGKKVWSNKDNSDCFSSVVPYGDKLIFQTADKIVEYENGTGKITREKVLPDYNFNCAAEPYINGNIAYIGTVNKGVIAFNLSTFELIWNFDEMRKNLIYTSQYSMGDIHTVDTTIVEKDGKLYFGGLDGYVYIVDKITGTLVKEINVGAPILAEISIVGNQLIVFDFSGNVINFNI